jgi:predicted dehydrogenase
MTSRRIFLMSAAAPAAVRRLAGANDRINAAVMGVRGRGREHISCFAKLPGARVTAICEIDPEFATRAQDLALELQGSKPEVYQDIRRVLDNKNIDVVSMATPNHWHALATIWACQAG